MRCTRLARLVTGPTDSSVLSFGHASRCTPAPATRARRRTREARARATSRQTLERTRDRLATCARRGGTNAAHKVAAFATAKGLRRARFEDVTEIDAREKRGRGGVLFLSAFLFWPLLARITRRGWQRLASVPQPRVARCHQRRTLGTRRWRLAGGERDRERRREHHVDEAHHGSSHRRGRATPTTSHGGAVPQLRVFTTSPGSSIQRAGEVGKRTKSVRPDTSSRRNR